MKTPTHPAQICPHHNQVDTGATLSRSKGVSQTRPEGSDELAACGPAVPAADRAGQSLLRALRKPAGSSLGVSRARQHLTNMRIKLNEAKQAGRQTDKDLRELSSVLRRWPEGVRTQSISWTDETGNRQTNIRLSEAEVQQVEADLDNQRLRQDDHISSLERLVDGAQRSAEGAQRDFDSNLQFQSNMSRMQHQTSMHIIGNIGR